MEFAENAPKAVLCQRAGAFVDITVEQGADAYPERRDQAGPGVVEPGGELISCVCGVGEQGSEHAAVGLVVHGFAAPRELTGNLRRVGRADFRQLGSEAWPGGPRRRGEEVWHIAA